MMSQDSVGHVQFLEARREEEGVWGRQGLSARVPSKGKLITSPMSGFVIWFVQATVVTSPNAALGGGLRRLCWQGEFTINTCVR